MTKRILVFDDKPENLRVAQQAYEKLAKYGFSVETTSNPDEALDKIEKGEADILVTDLYAPREMISPRILDRWNEVIGDTAKYFKNAKGESYIFEKPGWGIGGPEKRFTLKKFFQAVKRGAKTEKKYPDWNKESVKSGKSTFAHDYADHVREGGYVFKHPDWGGRISVPYEEIASLRRMMLGDPLRREKRKNKEVKGTAKNVPVGVVLYAAAQEKGIPANIISDTHRHALAGSPDVRGSVLPLLVKDPSLVVYNEQIREGYLDPSRIRTNANKQEASSWYYGGGYGADSASFLPEELRGLSGKTLEEKLKQGESDKGIGLRKKLTPVIATLGLLSGIFFLSNNITGNAIANVSQSSGNILGAVLLVIGLVAGFFWVKKK